MRLVDQDDDQAKDDKDQQEDAPSPASVLLISVANVDQKLWPLSTDDHTHFVATFNSSTAPFTSLAVSVTLYSTQSSTVPCSTTRFPMSRKRSASSEIDLAISVSS